MSTLNHELHIYGKFNVSRYRFLKSSKFLLFFLGLHSLWRVPAWNRFKLWILWTFTVYEVYVLVKFFGVSKILKWIIFLPRRIEFDGRNMINSNRDIIISNITSCNRDVRVGIAILANQPIKHVLGRIVVFLHIRLSLTQEWTSEV